MKSIYTTTVFAICTYSMLLAIGLGEQYCFYLTWPGSRNMDNVDCSNHTPCIKPFYNSPLKPNTDQIWDDIKGNVNESKLLCELKSDNVCITYTYIFNDAVVNVSYFCGKVIEDQTKAVTSGCYAQYTEGYTIEACACQSRKGKPCTNATIRNTYSILITVGAIAVTLFMYKNFNIP